MIPKRRVHRPPPAFGGEYARPPGESTPGPVIGLAVLILLLVAYDVLSLRRVHRATIWAAPTVFAAGALAVTLCMTPAWYHFAEFVMRTAMPYV